MGSVKYYSPTEYRAVLRWTDELGKSRTRTRVCTTKQEAEQALKEFRAERDKGLAKSRPATLGDLLATWLEVKLPDVAQATQGQYKWAVEKLTPISGAKLTELRSATLDRAIGEVEGSARSRQIARTVLRAACAWGVSQGLLVTDPAKGTRAIKQERKELTAWTPAQIERFKRLCETERLGPLYLTLATLGLRRGEALALRWDDYDPTTRTLTINKSRSKAWDSVVEGPTKTARSQRVIPVPEPLAAVLEAHRVTQRAEVERLLSLGIRAESGYMFLSDFGKALDPDTVSHKFARLARSADLGERHLHELRHLAASLLLSQGVPMPVISRVLGHSSTAVTDTIYAHLAVEDLRVAIDSSSRLLGS
ncbi:site-specific integrase [Ferrimicrobium sp.]|uniref:tyrosine-type recombinase/integrase n=1 Tax=Ferrimicrobium sp. TaxID=2926050 RepID=UPI002629D695|nr:site-specific integrase [Ferrimicrobium sp.]